MDASHSQGSELCRMHAHGCNVAATAMHAVRAGLGCCACCARCRACWLVVCRDAQYLESLPLVRLADDQVWLPRVLALFLHFACETSYILYIYIYRPHIDSYRPHMRPHLFYIFLP
jgi:hypothetical protein